MVGLNKQNTESQPKVVVVKSNKRKSKYHKTKLKLNKDGSITIYE
jgi:hypothetical protein